MSRSDHMKGFVIAKDEYVLLDKEDFQRVKLGSMRTRSVGCPLLREWRRGDKSVQQTPYLRMPPPRPGRRAGESLNTTSNSSRKSNDTFGSLGDDAGVQAVVIDITISLRQ